MYMRVIEREDRTACNTHRNFKNESAKVCGIGPFCLEMKEVCVALPLLPTPPQHTYHQLLLGDFESVDVEWRKIPQWIFKNPVKQT